MAYYNHPSPAASSSFGQGQGQPNYASGQVYSHQYQQQPQQQQLQQGYHQQTFYPQLPPQQQQQQQLAPRQPLQQGPGSGQGPYHPQGPQQQPQQPQGYAPGASPYGQQPQQPQPQQQQQSGYYNNPGNTVMCTMRKTQGLQSAPAPGEGGRYDALRIAAERVVRAGEADREISMDMGFRRDGSGEESYRVAPTDGNFRPFQIAQSINLPEELMSELETGKDSGARTGLFEEIERAWFVIGNKLFLWDYTDIRYDEQAANITGVGLVKARKDVFVDDITHVLVVCTASSVSLLGLSRPSPRTINLYATSLVISAPAPFCHIIGTDAGRIFAYVGRVKPNNTVKVDQSLYEITYGSGGSGFLGLGGSKGVTAAVTNRVSNVASLLGIVGFGGGPAVLMATVDPARDRLFAYMGDGTLRAFNVGGTAWESLGASHSVKTMLSYQAYKDVRDEVAQLAPVLKEESSEYWVVVILVGGHRVYLSKQSFTGVSTSPSTRHRDADARLPEYQGSVVSVVGTSYATSGLFVAVQNTSTGGTASGRLVVFTAAYGRRAVVGECTIGDPHAAATNSSGISDNFSPFEEVSVASIDSEVQAIAEFPSSSPATLPSYLRTVPIPLPTSSAMTTSGQTFGSSGSSRDVAPPPSPVAMNPLCMQADVSPRRILILTSRGLHIAYLPRAVDMLASELENDKEVAHGTSANRFGRVQTMAMTLLVGADSAQTEAASNVIAHYGGVPSLRDDVSGTRQISFSSRHEAYALTVARFLRPIWTARIVLESRAGPAFRLAASDTLLRDVQARLERLKTYTDNNPFPRGYGEEGSALAKAWDQEEISLLALATLVEQAIEGISFVLLLADYKLADVLIKSDEQTRSTFVSMSYGSFLTTTAGRDVARRLVTKLIELQIGQEMGIDNLNDILQQRCKNFCEPGDVVMYKAEESIRRAEASRDAAERRESLQESLRLFTRAGTSLPLPKLVDATQRYQRLDFISGAIELPLSWAAQRDPQDRASDYVEDGEHDADPRKAFYESRMTCYSYVVEVLGALDEALDKAAASEDMGKLPQKRNEGYAVAIASDDELFHFYLYDWLVARGLSEQLLEIETPYVEKYLLRTTSTVPGRRDLLWKYYERNDEHFAAARAAHDLAVRPSDMTLDERSFYLAQALTSASSAIDLTAEDVQFKSMLQDQIEVVQVQAEVARAVAGHADLTQDERTQALGELNGGLLDLEQLLRTYAMPYRLFEQILLILRAADTRIDDVCEAVWRELVGKALRDADAAGVARESIVGNRLRDWVRRFYPSEAAPLDIVVMVVYGEGSAMLGSPGWASEAMVDGGVGLRDLWDVAVECYEAVGQEQAYYAEELGALAERWIRVRDQIPAAEVERFASAYILQTSGNGKALDERVRRTRERFERAKAAMGR